MSVKRDLWGHSKGSGILGAKILKQGRQWALGGKGEDYLKGREHEKPHRNHIVNG